MTLLTLLRSQRTTPVVTNFTKQLDSYKGILGWNGFTAGDGTVWPSIEVPLFIKEHPVPFRKPKVTEINTIPVIEPNSGKMIHVSAVFWGAPDLLTLSISGWILTPISNGAFVPVDKAGNPLPVGNISYAEVVSAFLEGRMNPTLQGAWQRKDPDYYISPHGHLYINPVVSIWEPQYSVNMKKQPFSMTLYLEK